MTDVRLLDEDPQVFARCPKCCAGGIGVPFGQVFLKAYPPRKWDRGQSCDNCDTPMERLYEVRTED